MKRNDITLGELQDWLASEEVIYASSSRERKRLFYTLGGGLKVAVAGRIVWEGIQPFAAVEAYNAITETYKDDLKEFKI